MDGTESNVRGARYMGPAKVWTDVYRIGKVGDDFDCSVYVIDTNPALVLIDSGTCGSFDRLVGDLEELGLDPKLVGTIIATHSHFDHVGSLHDFKEKFGTRIIAHELDAEAMQTGRGTYAEMMGLVYKPCEVDVKLRKDEKLKVGQYKLNIVHIPGHTPGGIACYLDSDKRILFGQDVNGPYDIPGADAVKAKDSLQRLIDLNADILCEGHFGVFEPANAARSFIEGYLRVATSLAR